MFLLSGLDRGENLALVRVLSGLVLVLVIFNFDETLGNLPVWSLAVVTTPSVCDCRALSGRDRCLRAGRFGLWRWPAVATRAEVLAGPDRPPLQCPVPLLLVVPLRALVGRLAVPLTDASVSPARPVVDLATGPKRCSPA
jgi:hypothetical protein